MSYPKWFNEIIRCPETGELLELRDNGYFRSDGKEYQVKDGILSIVYPHDIIGEDAKMNKFYNWLAPLYDFNERVIGKLFTGVDIAKGREKIISFLGLKSGMKILEVSPGPGVFQPYLRQSIQAEGEIVSLDLSIGMLKQCRLKNKELNIQLVHGNAQYLPFADESFDALFHFGGVNLFNEPQKAINEFARVVKKEGIVSWGDEGFSKNYPNNFRKKILIKMNPGFIKDRPPIPQNMTDIKEFEVYEGMAYLIVGKKK
ncbi:MAG TPA: methyltransferase domain-containing protein [Ignavibacteriaceae bacterium]|nr:methyltransferase domain-containing protein [Ignavibacteriaceae bacterium]